MTLELIASYRSTDLNGAHPLLKAPNLGDESWWREVRAVGTPLVGAYDKVRNQYPVTFIVRENDDICAIYIEISSHTPHITEAATPLKTIATTQVWIYHTYLPSNWSGSYFFVTIPRSHADIAISPEHARERRTWWIDVMNQFSHPDKFSLLNARDNGWGRAFSYIHFEKDSKKISNTDHQKLDVQNLIWESQLNPSSRYIWRLSTTRKNADAQEPLLILLLDGHYWIKQHDFLTALNELTQSKKLLPANYIFIEAIDTAHRAKDLTCNPLFWESIIQELFPLIQSHWDIKPSADSTIVIGESFGGLASVYAALNYPSIFTKAISLSGSFWWPKCEPNNTRTGQSLSDTITHNHSVLPEQPEKINGISYSVNDSFNNTHIYLTVGCYETDMIDESRAMFNALEQSHIPASYSEFNGGHDWWCWQLEILRLLQQLQIKL